MHSPRLQERGRTVIPRDFLVNLPAQVAGLPSVPGIGYSFGKLAPGFGLDMRLSAGELLGLAKVIAAPKDDHLGQAGSENFAG